MKPQVFDRPQGWSRRAVLAASAAMPLLASRAAFAQGHDPRFDLRVIESGHSLTDPIVPMLNAMLSSLGVPQTRPERVIKSTIPGSPMEWRWENRVEPGPDARHDIGNFDVLVITERVSLANTMPWHRSEEFALKWFENALTNGNGGKGAQTILYATWVDVVSGPDFANPYNDPEGKRPFRERLDLEMARWQAIADSVNAKRPEGSPVMKVIPGPLIMAAVYDAIAAGTAPGLADMKQLFEDDIHVNAAGAYLISLAHLAVIYDFDPRRLTGRLAGLEPQDKATSDWMKELVHEVLSAYPDAHYTGK